VNYFYQNFKPAPEGRFVCQRGQGLSVVGLTVSGFSVNLQQFLAQNISVKAS